jgi:hypothetical protein
MLYTKLKKLFQNIKKQFFGSPVLESSLYHANERHCKLEIDKNPLAMVSYKYAKFYSEVVNNSNKRNKKLSLPNSIMNMINA